MAHNEWLRYVRNAEDFFKLSSTFQGLPATWFRWVEEQTLAAERRGVTIIDPLAYRMSALWNGIVLLQESKFICDTIENALRKSLTDFILEKAITYNELTIPNWNRIQKNIGGRFDEVVSQSDIVLYFTFYELYETIVNNWHGIPRKRSQKPGFKNMFWKNNECRDMNRFKWDMKKVNNERNHIAHSKKLYKLPETQLLYKIASVWLVPLNVEVKERILTYRSKRPKFLTEVELV